MSNGRTNWRLICVVVMFISLIPSSKPSSATQREVKVFQDNEVPPEETLEFRMSSEQGNDDQQGPTLARHQALDAMNDLYCMLNARQTPSGEFSEKNSLCSGSSCTEGKMFNWLLSLCKRNRCGFGCRKDKDWSSCVLVCSSTDARPRNKRSVDNSMSGNWPTKFDKMSLLTESENNLSSLRRRQSEPMWEDKLRHDKPQLNYISKRSRIMSAVEKRYRLSLYDCIASYCGELTGANRKSCILYHCHRLRA